MRRCPARSGFSLVELIVVVAVMGLIAMIVLPMLARSNRHHNHVELRCVRNLKNIGLAFRIYATDNGDRFPGEVFARKGASLTNITAVEIFRALSNELSTPKIITCRRDEERGANDALSFATLTSSNISYFASLSTSEQTPGTFLAGDRNWLTNGQPVLGVLALTTNTAVSWSKKIHNEQGNIVMSDGSVQTMSSSRLRSAVRDQEWATNYIAFP